MTSKEYIENAINELVVDFKNIKCSYTFEDYCDIHFVQVLPQSAHDSDDLIARQIDLIEDFSNKFHHESLSFISEDSLYSPHEFILEIQGELYMKDWIHFIPNFTEVQKPTIIDAKKPTFKLDYEYFIAA